ncbi:hypothetical protein BC830DRAFT_1145906 [Chytriomyces sp. MP71]|nr:hypothetical protein BC830DRAFT_1145906 [Chytriomyces sp. MP71]
MTDSAVSHMTVADVTAASANAVISGALDTIVRDAATGQRRLKRMFLVVTDTGLFQFRSDASVETVVDHMVIDPQTLAVLTSVPAAAVGGHDPSVTLGLRDRKLCKSWLLIASSQAARDAWVNAVEDILRFRSLAGAEGQQQPGDLPSYDTVFTAMFAVAPEKDAAHAYKPPIDGAKNTGYQKRPSLKHESMPGLSLMPPPSMLTVPFDNHSARRRTPSPSHSQQHPRMMPIPASPVNPAGRPQQNPSNTDMSRSFSSSSAKPVNLWGDSETMTMNSRIIDNRR